MTRTLAAARARALLLPLLLAAAAATGQPSSAPRPVQVELFGERITLAGAVERTLRNNTRITQQVAKVKERAGSLQEFSGFFDDNFIVETNASSREQAILRSDFTEELRRRFPTELVAIDDQSGELPIRGALDRAADSLSVGLGTRGSIFFDQCQPTQTTVNLTTADGRTFTICLFREGGLAGVVLPSEFRDGASGVRSADDLSDIELQLAVLRGLNNDFLAALQEDLRRLMLDISDQLGDLIRNIALSLRTSAAIFRIQRALLGEMPEAEQVLELRFEIGRQFLFRNGMKLRTTGALIGNEDNYADKSLNPARGDTLFPNTFTTTAALNWNVPLGKNRGRIATAAPELASREGLKAERHVLAHTAALEVLATIEAYWNLALSQERVRLLASSAESQRQLLVNTQELIRADELPGVEEARARARFEETMGRLVAARREVIEARIALVEAMGGTTQREEDAPLAAESPRDGAAAALPAGLRAEASARRQDLQAARAAVEANDILARSARANLRRVFDFALNLSYSAFHESFDQRIYDLEGYFDAASGHIAGPSIATGIRVELPFGNNAARGRLVQARAALGQAQIQAADVDRQIDLRLAELGGTITRQRAELERQRENLAALERTLEASLERFRAGELTLIDTLTTEQQLTDARLAVAQGERELAVLSASLRFEAGQLLELPSAVEDYAPERFRLAGSR